MTSKPVGQQRDGGRSGGGLLSRMVVATVLSLGGIVALTSGSVGTTDRPTPEAQEGDLPVGTYTYRLPWDPQGEATVAYVAVDEWLREVPATDEFPGEWDAILDGRVYSALPGEQIILVDERFPDRVPEGFFLDAIFLRNLERGQVPEHAAASSRGVAASSDRGPSVPQELEVHGERFEMIGFSPTIDLLPAEAIEQRRAEGWEFISVEADDDRVVDLGRDVSR